MWVPAIALVAAAGSVAAAGGDADRYLLTRQEPYNQPGSATTAKVSPESLDSPAAAERGNSAGPLLVPVPIMLANATTVQSV
jgi:hypothetical protein